jgi:hypothetical protein
MRVAHPTSVPSVRGGVWGNLSDRAAATDAFSAHAGSATASRACSHPPDAAAYAPERRLLVDNRSAGDSMVLHKLPSPFSIILPGSE